MAKQRRLSLRARIVNSISMIDAEGNLLFDVKDISEGGAFIYSDLLMQEGEDVTLSFTLPGSERVITTKANIIRSEKNEDNDAGAGMAVRFVNMDVADSRAINDYILKYLSGA